MSQNTFYSAYDENNNLSIFNIIQIFITQKNIFYFFFILALILSLLSKYIIYKPDFQSEIIISESKNLKFNVNYEIIEELKGLSLGEKDFINSYAQRLNKFEILKLAIEKINSSESSDYKITNPDEISYIYKSINVSIIENKANLEEDGVKLSFNIKHHNNEGIGKLLISEIINASNASLNLDIIKIIENRILSIESEIETKKLNHIRDIDDQIELLKDAISLKFNRQQHDYRKILKKLEDNLLIAKNLNFSQPQLQTIIQSPIKNSVEASASTISRSFYSDEMTVPPYFFGTNILENEISIIEKKLGTDPMNDLSLGNLFIDLSDLQTKKKDIYIRTYDLEEELIINNSLKKYFELNNNIQYVNYYLNQINAFDVSPSLKEILFIAFLLSLLFSITVSLFLYELKKRKISNNINES